MVVATQEVSQTIRILITEDRATTRIGIKKALGSQADMQVVGEAANSAAAVELSVKLKPDILLLDSTMASMAGIEALRSLRRLQVQTKPILLTAALDRPGLVESVQLGARGVILKEACPDLLFKCIRCVAAGQYWVDHRGVCDIVDALKRSVSFPDLSEPLNAFGLTQREFQIVAAIRLGESNKEIAKKLHIRHQTVKNHLTTIFDKLGVSTRLELMRFAIERLKLN